MDIFFSFLIVILPALSLYLLWNTRKVVVFEYERGLLFKRGKYERLLEPGQHWYFRSLHTVRKIDIRSHIMSLPGQEVLSADNVGVKLSIVCSFKVVDPHLALVAVENYTQVLYTELQVNLRDIVGELPIDDFLSKRKEIGELLFNRSKDKSSDYGIVLESAAIKDIMFPGELKRIFAQVVNARKEGLAALERARGESAALRSLANTSKLLENNPGLLQLRLLQTIDKNPSTTIILGDISESPSPKIQIQGGKENN